MKELQELKLWAEAEKEKADAMVKKHTDHVGHYHFGRANAFSDMVKKAELLLHGLQPNSDPAPPLPQASCSTLREFVGDKLDKWVEADTDELGRNGRFERDLLVREYSELLKFIDAQQEKREA